MIIGCSFNDYGYKQKNEKDSNTIFTKTILKSDKTLNTSS